MIYTIGHSNHPIEKFIELLQAYKVETIVEVRSVPKSSYSTHFNKPNLIYELSQFHIQYSGMLMKMLGGRPEDTSVLNSDNKIDEALIEKKEWYKDGIKKLISLSKESKIAIMCSEENPKNCHRGYIISHALLKKGEEVHHIRGDGSLQKASYISKQVTLF